MRFSSKNIDPSKIKIDDRSFSDLINFVAQISKDINFYNKKNKISSTFYNMFSSDESFLISEISRYNLSDFYKTRNRLIKKFDSSENQIQKTEILNQYLKINFNLYYTINDWFVRAFGENVQLSNTPFQDEIESIVKKEASRLFMDFMSIINTLNNENINSSFDDLILKKFKSSLWKTTNTKYKKINSKQFNIDLIFKKIILNSNSIFNSIETIVKRSENKLKFALNKSTHNPHIGLLFSFIELFGHLQNDLNKITKSHLDYYYKDVLKIKKNIEKPNTTYSIFTIDENLEHVVVDKSEIIIAGQYEDGSDVKYQLDDDIILNNVKISYLMSLYVSKNPIFEYNSRYNLISSVYSKIIACDQSDIESFNNNSEVFNALGSDQITNGNLQSTMDYAKIGFAIGSPSFRMGKSTRKIDIQLEFNNSSIQNLSDLIIDISNNTDLNDNEVFNKIFIDSFDIYYTSDEKWEYVSDFQLIMPKDWSSRTITFTINLNKSAPKCANYNKDLHGDKFNSSTPIFQFLIKQNSFYNAYAFLKKMSINNISIDCNVTDLRDFKVFRDGQEISTSSEFELFGANPKFNSSFYLGCEEIFNKNVDSLKIKWDYSNLDEVEYNLKDYYQNYNRNINNESFKIKFSLLSDFNFFEINNKNDEYILFDTNADKIIESKSFEINNILESKLNPNYKMSDGSIDEFKNDYETGLIKATLVSPNFGFGFSLYPKLYSNSLYNQSSPKQRENSQEINEPYIPKVDHLSIDYNSKSNLFFEQENRSKNNFDEDNSFFQISHLGVKRTFSDELIDDNLLVNLKNEGELIIGFRSNTKIKNLDIFFEIIKNENDNYDFSRKLQWFYSSNDDWKPLRSQNILSDGSNNLLNSGVISFIFPEDFTNQNYILNPSEYYLKVTSKNKADQLGLIKSIYTNAAKVSEIIPDDLSKRLDILKKDSLQNLEKSISGVNSIYQPIDSKKIKLYENDIEYYNRVSQLLKHKNRPVTKSDIESYLIYNFSFLSYVKCIDNSNNKLSILCFKKIQTHQNIEEIKLSASEKKEILNEIIKYISPHIEIEILNPLFEDIWIKCFVQFSEIQAGRGLEKLNSDLLNYICPWRSSSKINFITNKIFTIDILNFIKKLKYVNHVTGFSVIHFKKYGDNNDVSLFDSAAQNQNQEYIESGSPRSVIVPRNNHKITIINNNDYYKSSPVKLEDLEIDKSFVIKQSSKKDISKYKKKNNDDLKNLQFIIN